MKAFMMRPRGGGGGVGHTLGSDQGGRAPRASPPQPAPTLALGAGLGTLRSP